MHRENEQSNCVTMSRTAMREHLEREGAPIPDDWLLSKKITAKRDQFIKGACSRLVHLGHLVSKTNSRGVRMYALPQNKDYL
jgi:hypothetical protein